MPVDTLGIAEINSIALGAELADSMVKASNVALLRAATICSGRFLIFVSGDREAVAESIKQAEECEKKPVGMYVISSVSPLLIEALKKSSPAEKGESLGVVECSTVSSGVYAADTAVKKADVRLLRFVAGQGIMGKSYFVLAGQVAAVREAVQAADEKLGSHRIASVVIPHPSEQVAIALAGTKR